MENQDPGTAAAMTHTSTIQSHPILVSPANTLAEGKAAKSQHQLHIGLSHAHAQHDDSTFPARSAHGADFSCRQKDSARQQHAGRLLQEQAATSSHPARPCVQDAAHKQAGAGGSSTAGSTQRDSRLPPGHLMHAAAHDHTGAKRKQIIGVPQQDPLPQGQPLHAATAFGYPASDLLSPPTPCQVLLAHPDV